MTHTKTITLLGLILAAPTVWAFEVAPLRDETAAHLCNVGDVIYFDRNGSYKLRVPELAQRTFVEDRTLVPSITSHLSITDIRNGFIYVVSTRIPDTEPKDPESVLHRIEERRKIIGALYPKQFSSRFQTDATYGKVYEFTLLNPVRGLTFPPYPFSYGVQQQESIENPKTIAIHRFFAANGHLFEFIALLDTKKDFSGKTRAELSDIANLWLEDALAGFSPGKFENCAQVAQQGAPRDAPQAARP